MTVAGRMFCVRLTGEEYVWLSERSEAAGLSRSEWARRVLGGVTLGQHVAGVVEGHARQVWRCGGGVKHDLLGSPVGVARPDVCPVCGAWGTLEDVGLLGVSSSGS